MVFGIFGGGKKVEKAVASAILPSDVRYALQYREANLGKSEILDLALNRFEDESLYAFLKALSGLSDVQKNALTKIVAEIKDMDEEQGKDAIRDFVQTNMPSVPESAKVGMMKLGQYSRQGFEEWRRRYAEEAQKAALRAEPTVIVGHSMFMGLRSFVRAHQLAHKPLYILMPHMIDDTDSTTCGYIITNGVVEFLPKDFARPENAIIIDDVKNKGETEREVQAFWQTSPVSGVPTFSFLSVTG